MVSELKRPQVPFYWSLFESRKIFCSYQENLKRESRNYVLLLLSPPTLPVLLVMKCYDVFPFSSLI